MEKKVAGETHETESQRDWDLCGDLDKRMFDSMHIRLVCFEDRLRDPTSHQKRVPTARATFLMNAKDHDHRRLFQSCLWVEHLIVARCFPHQSARVLGFAV